MFEGDDYVGRPVNRAARLCDSAGPGQLLVSGVPRLPAWIEAVPSAPLALPGIGELDDVHIVRASDDIRAQLAASEASGPR
jgi:class 3 adenylate cyclase